MNYDEVIKHLESMGDPKNIEGMGRFGIKTENNLISYDDMLEIVYHSIKNRPLLTLLQIKFKYALSMSFKIQTSFNGKFSKKSF